MVNKQTAPPNGPWKGLVVNDSQFLRTELTLTFDGDNVSGYFTTQGRNSPPRGEFTGTIRGSTVTLKQLGDYGATFQGNVQPTGPDRWILFGLLIPADPREYAASLTVFQGEEATVDSGGVWAGDSVA